MFGSSKPSNATSGFGGNIASGNFNAFSAGNQQNDAAVQQVAQQITPILAALRSIPGAVLPGDLMVQHGVNTGFQVDWSGAGELGSGSVRAGKDAAAVVDMISRGLIVALEGISPVMQQIIDNTTDLSKLAENIQFGIVYEGIQTAFDSAFANLPSEIQKGPFQQASEQIKATFDGISAKASEFALSLTPISAALAEATIRLQGDFTTALNTALNVASGSGFINELQAVYDSTLVNIRDAQAVGLGSDSATLALLDQVYQAQINSILSGLDDTQLQEVITHFAGLNEAITILASSALTATTATVDLAAAQQLAAQSAQATQEIQDYLNQLNATPSAFVSPEDALAASYSQYATELAKAQAGDIDALSSITQYADQLIKNIETYYASSEAGQLFVDAIEAQLEALLGIQGTITDPAVLTNTLLTDQLAKTDTLTTTVATGDQQASLTITAGTQQLIDSNNAVAASTIAQNVADTNTLVGVTNATATAAIDANREASAALISANDLASAEIVAQSDAASQALIASNDNTTAVLIAQNDASSAAAIAANDNATAALIATGNADTAAILAGSSTDATAIGLVTQSVGNQLANVVTGLANSQISATYETASVALSSANAFTNSQLTAIYDSVHYQADIATALANNQITATYDAASSLINVGATYSNAQTSAIYGSSSAIVQSHADYANNQLIATSTASATNDNLLTQANSWLNGLYQATVSQNDTMIAQLQDLQNKMQQMLDELRLMRNSPPVGLAA